MKKYLLPTLVALAGLLVLGPIGLCIALAIYFVAMNRSKSSK
jgi:hypothetical protein